LNEETLYSKEEFYQKKKESAGSLVKELTDRSKTIIKLKDEVDTYAGYFNIKKIIEKQENKLKSQRKKLEEIEDFKVQNECIICMENERKVIFFPCLHLISCETCAFSRLHNECPTCNTKIEKREYVLS